MEAFTHNLFFFIVALGVLISFHEFGHFWVARKMGVKVLRFSIGFGTPLWRYQKSPSDTEFVISALPLGGYVKMVDEREGEVAADDLPYAFNRQSLAKRIAIVAAGPVFNLMLAVILYWIVLVTGEIGLKPVVGPVQPGTLAAQADLREGDVILSIEGQETPTWTLAISRLYAEILDKREIHLTVQTPSGDRMVKILEVPEEISQNPELLRDKLGLKPWEAPIPPIIDKVEPGSPAALAGIQGGDKVLAIDGQPVKDWRQVVEIIRQNPGRALAMAVERQGVEVVLTVTPKSEPSQEGKPVGKIGASVKVPPGLYDDLKVVYRLGPVAALTTAIAKTGEYSWLTVKVIGKMLIGQASVKNLSGPISIAQYAGQSAALGMNYFLKFLALVSISLGVLNLLPIPVLDGGHLMFYLIEGIKGSPVSEQTIATAQQIGMAILLLLMAFAFFLDFQRLFN